MCVINKCKKTEPTGDFLETLLTSFLQDITSAQDASNMYSACLAMEYSDPAKDDDECKCKCKDGDKCKCKDDDGCKCKVDKRPDCIKYFPVPVPVIRSFEFTFQFAFQAFANYVDNTLFADLKDTIGQFLTDNNQLSKPGDTESITHLIFEDVKAELITLLLKVKQKNEAIHKFAGYLQNKIADALKKHYQSLKTESPVNLKNIRTSLEDVLVDFNKPLTDWAKAFKNVKMVYDLNKLNSLNGDILCSLKVNVEMQNLQVGFDETIKSGDGENAKRRIRLA